MRTKYWKYALLAVCAILSLSVCALPVCAEKKIEDASITITGHERYHLAALIVEDINAERRAIGLNELGLDANLQEAAMTIAAEKAFFDGYGTQRPGNTSYQTVFPPSYKSVEVRTATAPGNGTEDENLVDEIRVLYTSDTGNCTDIVQNPSFVTIGVGVFQSYDGAPLSVCFMLYDMNKYLEDGSPYVKGEYKQTILNSKRVVDTKLAYVRISNDAELYSPVEDKKYWPYRDISIQAGETKPLTLLNNFVQNNMSFYCIIDSSIAEWKSNDCSIATVDGQGRVTGVKNGMTTVTATYEGRFIYYNITVSGGSQESQDKPKVKSLKDLPKKYQGPAIVNGKEVYVRNRKKVTGNVKIDGVTYYCKNGVKYTGWLTKGKKKYYYSNGVKVRNKIVKVKGKKYYLNKKGVMQTGQKKINGKYYYFDQSGVMQKNKWIKIKGKKYFFNKKGVRK